MPYIVKSIVITLDYHQERFHKDGKPNFDGLINPTTNQIVYWHKSNRGYLAYFKDIEEAQSVIDVLETQEDIFMPGSFEILDWEDPTISYGNLRLDYEIAFPKFAVLADRTFYTLPFDIIGKKARID